MSEKRIFKINVDPINPEEVEAHVKVIMEKFRQALKVEAHVKVIMEKFRQAPKVENRSTEKDTDPEETNFFVPHNI